ncbi:hypothetical protein LOZ51_001919 [Ophidiomyces ophidiicola]|nr:hypothetical protein LOZ55_001280 [Ophidiomyces ophidiicola]KAI1984613.1 hypothetical protein LOZ54_004489 [Ophidiomyces ophidiicola]KAI1999432.1 hypothetical protein LOZ51_001919 [Ophidiomyces ophidiicola]
MDANNAPNRVAVVTGGGGDIGRAIAAEVIKTRDHVVLVDIDKASVERAAQALGAHRATAIICDITDDVAVHRMAQEALALGAVNLLVNNAGGTWASSLQETTPEVWKRETALNLDASFLCFKAFEQSLKNTHGTVINIASVNGLSVYGNPAYSAAKAGLIHFTKSIAVEYGRFGMRANAIAPGTVRTQAWEERLAANPKVFEEAMQWYPKGHVIEPGAVAGAVAFLSSPEAASITGVCLPVDAGLTAGQARLASTFSQSQFYR